MIIQTTRFGQINVEDNEILNFEEGVLGFESEKQFFIIDPDDKTLILWLQSVKTPAIAFPIIEPNIIENSGPNELLKNDLARLNLTKQSEAYIYNILTIPKNVKEITANLKAPIVINSKLRLGSQIVLQDNKLDLKLNVYQSLKNAISSLKLSNDSIRSNIDISKEKIEQTASYNITAPRIVNINRRNSEL